MVKGSLQKHIRPYSSDWLIDGDADRLLIDRRIHRSVMWHLMARKQLLRFYHTEPFTRIPRIVFLLRIPRIVFNVISFSRNHIGLQLLIRKKKEATKVRHPGSPISRLTANLTQEATACHHQMSRKGIPRIVSVHASPACRRIEETLVELDLLLEPRWHIYRST